MKKILSWVGPLLVYLCVGTVLAEAVGLAYLGANGRLSSERLFDVAAAMHGVDLAALKAKYQEEAEGKDKEEVAFQQIIQARRDKSLDLDLREQAVRNGLSDLGTLQLKLSTERKRYDEVQKSFVAELERLKKGAKATAVTDRQAFIWL